ncbi:MAG: hypothetical protein MRJ93_10645 [Nitrososphaeraceae archaeon]|nr:hypothetical protein [Nitrososphaeraceae archaeon]
MEIECDECKQKFQNKKLLGIHLKSNHIKAFCGACKKEFKNKELLKEHVQNYHLIDTDNT